MSLGKVLDYPQARPPLGKVKANGYTGVYRYVCSDTSEAGLPGKRLTPTERDQILAAGLDIGLHGEDAAGAAQLGYAKGKEQGTQWGDYAHTVLAAPTGMTIVAAVDYDTGGTYPQVVSDYLHGVADGLAPEYKAGAYGSIYVVDAALAEGAAAHGVQTIAWSDGKVSTWAHLYQHGGTEFPGTDYNDVLRVPHGTWLQTLNGGDMLTADDLTKIEALIRKVLNEGTGQGLTTWAATSVSDHARLGDIFNQNNTQTAQLSSQLTKLSQQVAQSPALSGTLNVTGALNMTEQTP